MSGLGITAVWVLPFFPSPMADWGYDVTDYLDVDDQLGGMAAFVRFMRLAEEHGIRVIVDLPLNHTSTEHPWFQEARQSPDSKYRDYYIALLMAKADVPPAELQTLSAPGIELAQEGSTNQPEADDSFAALETVRSRGKLP